MSPIWSIFKREVSAYFNSPVAYVVVILFLAISGALFWPSYFQEFSLLSLRGFFSQAPMFLAFFAPAIAMASETVRSRPSLSETRPHTTCIRP